MYFSLLSQKYNFQDKLYAFTFNLSTRSIFAYQRREVILPLLFSLVKIQFPFFANSFIQLHSQSLNSISTNPPLSHFRISAAPTDVSTTSVCCQIHNLLFCISFLQLSRCDFLVMCSQFHHLRLTGAGV